MSFQFATRFNLFIHRISKFPTIMGYYLKLGWIQCEKLREHMVQKNLLKHFPTKFIYLFHVRTITPNICLNFLTIWHSFTYLVKKSEWNAAGLSWAENCGMEDFWIARRTHTRSTSYKMWIKNYGNGVAF